MVSYFGNPSCIIYGSAAAKEEVYDPTFECFGQVTPSKIPAQKSSKDANKLAEEYYRVQSFVDHLNTGLGYYMSRYLTRKLTDQDGYAMLCLKLDSDWSQTTENLVKVFTFNRDCNLKSDQVGSAPVIPADEDKARELEIQAIMGDMHDMDKFQIDQLKQKIKRDKEEAERKAEEESLYYIKCHKGMKDLKYVVMN